MGEITLHRLYLRVKYLIYYYTSIFIGRVFHYTGISLPQTKIKNFLNIKILFRFIRVPNMQVCKFCYSDNDIGSIEEELPYCMKCGGDYKYELGEEFVGGSRKYHRQMAHDCYGVESMCKPTDLIFRLKK